ITLILFFQVLVVVRDAALSVRTELVQSVRSLGAKGLDILRYVYAPACLPAVLTGLRVSAGTAIAALYLTETFATREGLGFYIMDSWTAFSYPRMYAAVVAMGVLGLLVYVGLDQLERRLCGWMRSEQT
ncbi:MAG: ABC transporter permease subunit, partial [Dehalococcoidia bacterium]|nr:ABC transporter permease subunit [Dehalococcoidia bacterium]